MRRCARCRGMTLLETLVAFAILSGVTLAALAMTSQHARFMAAADERFFAGLAAENLMVQDFASRAGGRTGEEDGEVLIAGRRYGYHRRADEVEGGLVQITYEVRGDDGRLRARLSALRAAS